MHEFKFARIKSTTKTSQVRRMKHLGNRQTLSLSDNAVRHIAAKRIMIPASNHPIIPEASCWQP